MTDDILLDLYLKLSNSARDPTQDASHLEALARWVEAQSDAEHAIASVKDCLFEIAKDPALFVAAAARWIVDDNYAALARALVREASVRHLAAGSIASYDLRGTSESDAILVAYRLCARAAPPALSLGWVLATVRDFSSLDAQRAGATLVSYLADELPGTTHRLLRSDTTALKELAVAKEALARLNDMNTTLAALPRLRELAMTPEMRLAHATFKRGEHRDIHRMARERSFFHHVATEFHFKYATRTTIAMKLGDQTHETSATMGLHEFSMELPLSETTDPLSGKLRRVKFAKGLPNQ